MQLAGFYRFSLSTGVTRQGTGSADGHVPPWVNITICDSQIRGNVYA